MTDKYNMARNLHSSHFQPSTHFGNKATYYLMNYE